MKKVLPTLVILILIGVLGTIFYKNYFVKFTYSEETQRRSEIITTWILRAFTVSSMTGFITEPRTESSATACRRHESPRKPGRACGQILRGRRRKRTT